MNWNDTPSNSDKYIRVRDITDRVEELRDQITPVISAGWNMPGYMPESEPAQFDNWDDAYKYIVDEMESYADQLADGDDIDRIHSEQLIAEAERIRELLTSEDIEEYAKINSGYGSTIGKFHYWISDTGEKGGLDDDEKEELKTLEGILEGIEGYGSGHNWEGNRYPDILINESALAEYAEQYADDIGAVRTEGWPCNHIDWEAAAKELVRYDYGTVEFDGVTFYYRNA